MSKVISVNVGSSSLKFKLYEMPEEKVICSGLAERIGLPMGNFVFKMNGEKFEHETPIKDHEVAVKLLVDSLLEHHCVESLDEIKGIGHRIVQGGPYFKDSVVVDDEVEKLIESLKTLRDKILLLLDNDLNYHIDKWSTLMNNIKRVADARNIALPVYKMENRS